MTTLQSAREREREHSAPSSEAHGQKPRQKMLLLHASRLSMPSTRTLMACPRWPIAPHRWMSAKAGEDATPPAADEAPVCLFEGPKGSLVTTMKRVSIANLTFALVSSPIICAATQAGGAPGKGIAMSALLLAFGGGTTGALTWATRTYVKSIHSVPDSTAIAIVTPTFFGGNLLTEVPWEAVGRVDTYHPFATFSAAGRIYYLDEVGTLEASLQERLEAALNAVEGE